MRQEILFKIYVFWQIFSHLWLKVSTKKKISLKQISDSCQKPQKKNKNPITKCLLPPLLPLSDQKEQKWRARTNCDVIQVSPTENPKQKKSLIIELNRRESLRGVPKS